MLYFIKGDTKLKVHNINIVLVVVVVVFISKQTELDKSNVGTNDKPDKNNLYLNIREKNCFIAER